MTRFVTYSGRIFDLADPQPEMFSIRDIAHNLARIPRFGGNLVDGYSVAQHSVLVSDELARAGATPEMVAEGLMHDLAEAYTGDFPRPLKEEVPELWELERRILEIGLPVFGLGPGMSQQVWEMDNRACVTEAKLLYPEHVVRDERGLPADLPWPDAPPLEHLAEITCWSAISAEAIFLERFERRFARFRPGIFKKQMEENQ